MKIGFRTAGFREWSLPDALAALSGIGYDGVELCLEHLQMRPERLDPGRCGDFAAMVSEAGLEIASVSYHGDREDHDERRANQVRCGRIVQDLGAEILILNSEHVVAGREREQWAELVSLLQRELLPEALERGHAIAIEPEPGMSVVGTEEMLRLIDEVDHPALGVNLDVGHAWLTDRDLLQSVEALAPFLLHVHWEDFPAGEHKHLVPGQGDMPLRALHEKLLEVGYDGYYTIDLFNIADDPVRYAEESLVATRELLG